MNPSLDEEKMIFSSLAITAEIKDRRQAAGIEDMITGRNLCNEDKVFIIEWDIYDIYIYILFIIIIIIKNENSSD